jgi:hypothetical protein
LKRQENCEIVYLVGCIHSLGVETAALETYCCCWPKIDKNQKKAWVRDYYIYLAKKKSKTV